MNRRTSEADPEQLRLDEDAVRSRNWKRWGPYLAERQWGTVREDYSADGSCWEYFSHEHARSRAYRWGEDGLLGITDRQCRVCFALALWNGRDPILKERLFGLTNSQGNHGEDVKEEYFYLESTPTHSWMRALYKYPQARFPYERLVEENSRRGRDAPEFELLDTGVFEENRYFDVEAVYAKAGPDDVLVRIRAHNRGPEEAQLHLLPTLWLRNTWSWGCFEEGCGVRPRLQAVGPGRIAIHEPTLGEFELLLDVAGLEPAPELLFTENESNLELLFGATNASPWVKDAFHRKVVGGRQDAVNPSGEGSKATWHLRFTIEAGGMQEVRLRLRPHRAKPLAAFGPGFGRVLRTRQRQHDRFYAQRIPTQLAPQERRVALQAYAGLLWSKQFYHYAVDSWLQGDPGQPTPPAARRNGRNRDWRHLYNRDVLSVPDKWEYPWYAAWDLAFHMVPLAHVDPDLAKRQLLLLLREWYMHPNGQIPAYEFAFDDVNPPVHAWACWRVYKLSGRRGKRDRVFLARAFHKLLINFTWWVNRKDPEGRHLFSGGFLGLDNIGVFDRSRPLPGGGQLVQADATAWMAFYCLTMLAMATELAREDRAYEDVASKFFEHFVAIVDAINKLGGCGLWDEDDGFYYDVLRVDGRDVPLRLRSMVGLIPLLAVEVIDTRLVAELSEMQRRADWFLDHRRDLAGGISCLEFDRQKGRGLLAIPSKERLLRVLRRVLDEREFLSPHGLRSLSRAHLEQPFELSVHGQAFGAGYEPAESRETIFGGNSNWRGPVWLPLNWLLIEALERYHHHYGDELQVECPTGSGRRMNLRAVAQELARRVSGLFLPDAQGVRPSLAGRAPQATDPHWRELVLFHEYFDGETGRGLGASHQTGWTALVVRCLEKLARARAEAHNARAARSGAQRGKRAHRRHRDRRP